jgi:signal transduction histidine kinase
MSNVVRAPRTERAPVGRAGRPLPARPVAVAAADISDFGPGFDRAKESFLAAMGHELRTPLNAIIGFSEMMRAEIFGPLPAVQYRDYVEHILGSAQYLRQIIEDVLEISGAEARTLVLSKREVDLATLLAETCRDFDESCRTNGVSIVVDVPDDIVVKIDRPKIRRAVSCLLSNAVKFSGQGQSIGLTARLTKTGRVTITVEDHGIGIDPSKIELAFQPFVQLEDKLSRRFDGSGLGLPLARLLAELHGGSVTLASRPNVGTTATMVLPAYSSAAATNLA